MEAVMQRPGPGRRGASLVELKIAMVVLAVGFSALAHASASLARMVQHVQDRDLASGLIAPSGYVFMLEDGGPAGTEPAGDRVVIERVTVAGPARSLSLVAGGAP